jgi:aspartate/methionine/tyrosine aminotransferase
MDYSKLIAKTVQSVPPSGIRKYFDYLDEKTISLGVGEPDFPTPESIRREALERLSKGRIPYSSNAGIPELRELELKYIDSRFSMRGYDIRDVLITVGASQAIDLALRSVIDPGDEVIVPEIDVYRLASMAAAATTAGNVSAATVISASNAYSSILKATESQAEKKAPLQGRVAFVKPSFYNFLKLDSSFVKASEIAQNMLIKGQVGEVDGIKIVMVPSTYLPANTELS